MRCGCATRTKNHDAVVSRSPHRTYAQLVDDDVAVASFDIGYIRFHPRAGPRDCGLLEIICLPGSINATSIVPVITTLCEWFADGTLKTDFVTVFDVSSMTCPSVFSVYYIVEEIKKHTVALEAFKTYQQNFAITRGNSYIFNTVVDTMISASGCQTIPVFANDRNACLLGLKGETQAKRNDQSQIARPTRMRMSLCLKRRLRRLVSRKSFTLSVWLIIRNILPVSSISE